MSTETTSTEAGFDPHAPVSSVVGEEDVLEKDLVSAPPVEGAAEVDPGAPQEGLEAVAATQPPRPELLQDLRGLRPIGEASYGPVEVARSVFPPDTRVQIQNAHQYPWSAHASLLITARDGSRWIGTAWFIGPHTLATAGHVVFIKNSGVPGRDGWVSSIEVSPGRNGSSFPFGTVRATSFRSVKGWTENGNPEYDYGAIILSTNLGSRTGTFGFGAYTDATLTGSSANISGYPGDKPTGTQWYDSNRVESVGPRKVYYKTDTAGGQSGSAVYRIENGGRYGMAVHAYGGGSSNSGTRITKAVFDNFNAWRA